MDPLDLTGAWFGRYFYPPLFAHPPVSFWAAIVETGGRIEGTTSEPNTMGRSSDLLGAILHGTRTGRQVDFTKAYDGASDAAHAVEYRGELDASGELLTGSWRVGRWSGAFEMRRTHAPDAVEAVEEREEVTTRA
ncbi:MAG: hypothetical protein ACK40H_08510 [Sphingomonadaceae bacterium]